MKPCVPHPLPRIKSGAASSSAIEGEEMSACPTGVQGVELCPMPTGLNRPVVQ
jgi:hypothetical protein